MDRSLFDIKKLKAKTKISKTRLLEFQYADDCALVADSPEILQSVLNCIDALYRRMGLSINVQKTEILKFNSADTEADAQLNIRQEPLKEVTSFKYLGSHISNNCTLDDEIDFRIGRASSAYGRLRKRVFENHNITLHTKVMVYHAIVISTPVWQRSLDTVQTSNKTAGNVSHEIPSKAPGNNVEGQNSPYRNSKENRMRVS